MKTTNRTLTWRKAAVLSIGTFLYIAVICAGLGIGLSALGIAIGVSPAQLHAAPPPQGTPCTTSPNVGFFVPNIGNISNWGLCLNADLNSLDNLLGGSATLANNATPSATGFTNWLTANSGPVTITNFTGGFAGQTIRVLCSSGDTTTNINSTANISVLSNWNCAASSTLSLTLIGSVWREVGRGSGNVTGVALLGSPNTFTQANTFNTTLHGIGLAEFDAGISVDGIHPELIPVNTSTLVDLSAVQTLINKTLTSPAITGGTLASSTLNTPTVNGATFTSTLNFAGATGSLSGLTAGTGILGTIQTWTAAQTHSAAVNLNSGGALVGTFSGTHTVSGATTFSGAVTFSGSGTTGVLTAGNGLLATANSWSAVQTLQSPILNSPTLNSTLLNSPQIDGGIVNAGSGLEHFRFTTCTSGGYPGCGPVNQGFPGNFADTNYDIVCQVVSGAFDYTMHIVVVNKYTNSMDYDFATPDAGTVEADCIVIHD